MFSIYIKFFLIILLVERFFVTYIILTGAYDPGKRGQYMQGHIVVTPPIILAFAPSALLSFIS
jgi:hypothetical protein